MPPGLNVPPGVGGHTALTGWAALSSRLMFVKSCSLLQICPISTTVVLLGEVRSTSRSFMKGWLIFSPTRLMSDIVPMLSTVSVELTEPPSGIDLGTSVDAAETWQTGVFVGVLVPVGVSVGVLVRVAVTVAVGVSVNTHGPPMWTKMSSMFQPTLPPWVPAMSVPMRKRN